MFEQSFYNFEEPARPTKEGEFLHNYEIKSWSPSPRLYKILAASAVFNILAIIVAGQTSVLTMKGCDSPLVGRVCQALDMVYVGSMLFNTEREYVDAVYERTELADADITFVDVSGVAPPLTYPEGYFQIANPVEFAMMQQMNDSAGFDTSAYPGIPSFPNPSSGGLISQAPNIPKANPGLVKGGELNSAEDLLGEADPSDAKPAKGRGGKPNAAKPDEETTANANTAVPESPDESKADRFGVYINKRPMKDYAQEALADIEAEKIDLQKPFKVVITGTLGPGKDGKTIVLKNPKVLPQDPKIPNDPKMVKLAQEAILAVGDAGWFGHISKSLNAKNVVITVEQTETNFTANVRADQKTEEEAKTAASGMNTILAVAVPFTNGDEQKFLEKATTTSEGKTFILNFDIPKPLVQELIIRKLNQEKESKSEPNSTAVLKSGSVNAVK